jgi:hypothetical protein
MGICQDTEDSLKDFTFTPIEGQPTDEDINNLVEECSNAAASVPTSNGGGRHGHIGMLMEDADYQLISHGNAALSLCQCTQELTRQQSTKTMPQFVSNKLQNTAHYFYCRYVIKIPRLLGNSL